MNAFKRGVSMLALLAGCQLSYGGVVLDTTRVIYPESSSDVSIKVSSETDRPVLVQVWTDDGDMKQSPSEAKTPFVVLNPVFRIDPGKSQTIRMTVEDAQAFARDRESLYWLNVMEIPALKESEKEQNRLQIAVKHRVKVFYRPAILKGEAGDAVKQASWRHVKEKNAVHIVNPSPFYLSVARVDVQAGGKRMEKLSGVSIAPMSEGDVPLSKRAAQWSGDSGLSVVLVNDYGGMRSYAATPDHKFKPMPDAQ